MSNIYDHINCHNLINTSLISMSLIISQICIILEKKIYYSKCDKETNLNKYILFTLILCYFNFKQCLKKFIETYVYCLYMAKLK